MVQTIGGEASETVSLVPCSATLARCDAIGRLKIDLAMHTKSNIEACDSAVMANDPDKYPAHLAQT
jgi:hypothetical protein